jgi:HPt (histidine-containing phosphotransfer) domain-containing protein
LLFQVEIPPSTDSSKSLLSNEQNKLDDLIEEPLWQQDLFLKNFKGMEDMSADLLSMFVQHLPVTVSSLQQALDAQDIKKIGLLAHSLKSSAAQIGCTALSSAAKTLEMSTKNQPSLTWHDDTKHVLSIAQRTLQTLSQK